MEYTERRKPQIQAAAKEAGNLWLEYQQSLEAQIHHGDGHLQPDTSQQHTVIEMLEKFYHSSHHLLTPDTQTEPVSNES